MSTGTSVAAAAALIALSGAAVPAGAEKAEKTVHCYGVNACKGQSDCHTSNHDCKGMNQCKGQGYKDITAKQCAAQGGSLTEPK